MIGPNTACPAASFSIIGLRRAGLSGGSCASSVADGTSSHIAMTSVMLAAPTTCDFARFPVGRDFTTARLLSFPGGSYIRLNRRRLSGVAIAAVRLAACDAALINRKPRRHPREFLARRIGL